MNANRLIPVLLTFLLLAAACGDDDEDAGSELSSVASDEAPADPESDEEPGSTTTTVEEMSGDGDSDWCGRIRSIADSEEESPLSFSFLGLSADELQAQFETNLGVMEEWAEAAPSEIDADVDLVVDAYRTFVDKGNEAEWDIVVMSEDPAFNQAFDDQALDAASDRIDAYTTDVCGIDLAAATTDAPAAAPTVDEDADLVTQLLSAIGLPPSFISGEGRECMNDALEASGAFTEPIGPGYVPGEAQFDALEVAAGECGIAGLS